MSNFKILSMKSLLKILLVAALSPSAFASPAITTCAGMQNAHNQQEATLTDELRRSVESEKLFTDQAVSGVRACSVQFADGQIALSYRFRNGGRFQVKRDPAIEYTEQRAQIPMSSTVDPVTMLMDAEQHAFSPKGCGIDWQHGEQEGAEDAHGEHETVYRGATCNCQGRMRRDTHSKLLRLVLRSAC